LLRRLEDGRAASRQRRSPFPRLHEQWKIPGDDLADDADRLVARIAEIISLHRDGLAVNLVRPASVVAVALDGQRQVDVVRVTVRFAVVQGFQGSKLFAILLDLVSEFVQQPDTLATAYFR